MNFIRYLFLLSVLTPRCFAGEVAFVSYCPKMIKRTPRAWNREAEDAATAKAIRLLVGRWAPFSHLRAQVVAARSFKFLKQLSEVEDLPAPTGPRPPWVGAECTLYATATLDESDRPLVKKDVWQSIVPVERAAVLLELALTKEAPTLSVKALEGVRSIVNQMLTGDISGTSLNEAGLLISDFFSREKVFRNKDVLLFPPNDRVPGGYPQRDLICGFGIATIESGKLDWSITPCGYDHFFAYSFDDSRLLRVIPIPADETGLGVSDESDDLKPVYLFPPEKLGLPEGVIDYDFSIFKLLPLGGRVGVILKFDRDTTFETPRLRLRCKERTPVLFSLSEEDFEARDFEDLRFYGCATHVEAEVLLGGKFVSFPGRFEPPDESRGLHYMQKYRRLTVLEPLSLEVGGLPFTITPKDRVKVLDESDAASFVQDNSVRVTFDASSQREMLGTGFDCRPKLTALEEVDGIQKFTLSAKKPCRLTGLQARVRVKEFDIDAKTRRVVFAPFARVGDGQAEIGATNVRFRPNGELWAFRPTPSSAGLRYFDTTFRIWVKKEIKFPHVERLCYNADLRRFEDGRSSNPTCPK